jgi:hypothetical protein
MMYENYDNKTKIEVYQTVLHSPLQQRVEACLNDDVKIMTTKQK